MINTIRLGLTLGSLLIGVSACTPASDEMHKAPQAQEASTNQLLASAYGSVLFKDTDTRTLEITHSPVPEADWPIMQMQFQVANNVDMAEFVPGDAVEFVFDYSPADLPLIVAMRRTSPTELIGALWPEADLPEPSED
ncbi:MAG: copper-binding protein [Hyphomonas sp.]|nr:copper-binding protein [Hyphomonas sp.]